ncbi:MAG: response regulator [Bdellovibrionales bacterium]|nr:response regulator [Bdellovibrionales bacterium]
MAETMALLLKDEGYEATALADGLEGFENMKQAPPHLVILDVMMPIFNGLDIVRLMKKDSKLSSIPILLISASKEPEMENDKWNQFLRKPFDIYELIKQVNILIN